MDGFYDYLKSNNEKFRGRGLERPYYAKFCSVVQSSGTGKSRLLIELQNKDVLVLYMNLREPSDFGFPERDLVPARILTENMDCSQAEYTARCCALFAAIFYTLQQDLSAKVSSLHFDSTGAAIKYWNSRMCDMRLPARVKFFEKVQSRYQVILDEIRTPKSQESADRDAPTVEGTVAKLGSMSLTDASIKAPTLEGRRPKTRHSVGRSPSSEQHEQQGLSSIRNSWQNNQCLLSRQ